MTPLIPDCKINEKVQQAPSYIHILTFLNMCESIAAFDNNRLNENSHFLKF